MIPLARPSLGAEERAAVLAVLDSGQLAQGQRVEAFERAFAERIGVRHAVAVNSGTAALYVALQAHGIGPGDEVITTPFTFGATANTVLALGARPVFVDIEPATANLDPALVAAAITSRTKALLPVHLYGHPADLDPLVAIAGQRGLALIEDACQALGAEYRGRAAGAFGTGCFSFYPTKNITTGEGGMLTTGSDDIAALARSLRNHGQDGRYRYERLGLNWRMTDIAAAIGLAQLRKLDGWQQRRREIAARYDAALRGVVLPAARPYVRHAWHQYTVRVPRGQRDLFASELTMAGVGSAIYYPQPLNEQPLYRAHGYGTEHLPNAAAWAKETLSIPVHPSLSDDDVAHVIEAMNRAADKLGLAAGSRA